MVTLRVIYLSFLIICPLSGWPGIPEIQTARTMSTAGAGIASTLLNEATTLNPATVVFFNKSSFYYQKNRYTLDNETNENVDHNLTEHITIIDQSSSLKGGLSYTNQLYRGNKRQRFSFAFASPLEKDFSLGVIYKYTKEEIDEEKEKHQFLLGMQYIQSEKFSYAITINDPFYEDSEDLKITIGTQYVLSNNLTLVYDIGTGDMKNPDKKSFALMALQLKAFERLLVRFGQGKNLITNTEIKSWGASWIGPRFSIDYAFKSSEQTGDKTYTVAEDEKVEEVSFALTLLI